MHAPGSCNRCARRPQSIRHIANAPHPPSSSAGGWSVATLVHGRAAPGHEYTPVHPPPPRQVYNVSNADARRFLDSYRPDQSWNLQDACAADLEYQEPEDLASKGGACSPAPLSLLLPLPLPLTLPPSLPPSHAPSFQPVPGVEAPCVPDKVHKTEGKIPACPRGSVGQSVMSSMQKPPPPAASPHAGPSTSNKLDAVADSGGPLSVEHSVGRIEQILACTEVSQRPLLDSCRPRWKPRVANAAHAPERPA